MSAGRLLLCVVVGILFCCINANVNVYTDSVQAPFQDWTWNTKSPSSTPSYIGSYSYSFVPSGYNAVYFYNQGYITPSAFTGVTFWIYRTSTSALVHFNLVTYSSATSQSTKGSPDSSVTSYLTNSAWPVNTWVQGTVSFSPFYTSTTTAYDGLWFQDAGSPSTAGTVYIDQVVLTSATGTTATSAVTSAAATTAKAATSAATSAATTAKAATSAATTAAATSASATTAKIATTAATSATTAATSAVTSVVTSASATTSTSTSGGSTTGSSTINPSYGDPVIQALYNSPSTGGLGTYYGAYSSGGACSLDPTPTAGLNVANTVAIANFMNSQPCGMCLQVNGSGVGSGANPIVGTSIVFVNNQCPSCATNGLDFGLNGDGAWDITWQGVPCPVGSTNIQYLWKSGSSAFWLGLQPRNTRYPIYTFEILVGGAWVSLPRQAYNYFVASFSGSGVTFPTNIRMNCTTGQSLIDTIQNQVNGVTIIGNVQCS